MQDVLGQTSGRLCIWTMVLPQNCFSHSILGMKPSLCLKEDDKRESFLELLSMFIVSTSLVTLFIAFCHIWGFLGDSEGKESPHNGWDPGLIPGLGRSPGEGNSYPFQYSCQENSMDRGAWRAIGHEVAKSWTWLRDLTLSLFLPYTHKYFVPTFPSHLPCLFKFLIMEEVYIIQGHLCCLPH